MNIKHICLIILVLLFIPSIFGYQAQDLSTIINVRDNGTLEISNKLLITDINQDKLIFDIVPVYDLILNISGEIPKYNYTDSKLEIDISEYKKDKITIDIIYLTDKFTKKQDNVWNITYYPVFTKSTGSYKLVLPENSEIIKEDNFTDNKYNYNISVVNNRLTITDINVSYFTLSYSFVNQKLLEKNNYKVFLFIAIIIILLTLFIFLKLRSKKKDIPIVTKKEDGDINTKNLLLGLNENEQKIIKLLLLEDGLSQQKIALKLFLPKGTISRNTKKLQDKGYIEIKKYGVTNKIFLSSLFETKKKWICLSFPF